MLLTPRYDGPPVISVEVREPGPHPVLQQRERLGAILETLSEEEWAHPSRCDGWSTHDVVTHLTSTNSFWSLSIQAGLSDEPTRYLAAFDPVASPAQHAEQQRGTAVAETLAGFLASTRALAEVIRGMGEDDWDRLAEAPPGHVPIWLVADHALWDGWVHERDITVPLGLPPAIDDAEVLTILRYGAALGPAFAAATGLAAPDPIELSTTGPAARVVVETDDGVVRVHEGAAPAGAGSVSLDAVPLVELLSRRDAGVAAPPELASLTAGLAMVFDQPTPV